MVRSSTCWPAAGIPRTGFGTRFSDPIVQVEIAGDIHSGLARMVEDPDEAARARTLVFEKYAPRSDDDLSEWRDRADSGCR